MFSSLSFLRHREPLGDCCSVVRAESDSWSGIRITIGWEGPLCHASTGDGDYKAGSAKIKFKKQLLNTIKGQASPESILIRRQAWRSPLLGNGAQHFPFDLNVKRIPINNRRCQHQYSRLDSLVKIFFTVCLFHHDSLICWYYTILDYPKLIRDAITHSLP